MKSAKSNVGPNTEGEEKSGGVVTEGDTGVDDVAPTGKPAMSQADVILSLKAMCQANGLNVLDIVDALLAEFTAPADAHSVAMKKSA